MGLSMLFFGAAVGDLYTSTVVQKGAVIVFPSHANRSENDLSFE
jgi:hypothetical protein